MAWRICIYIFVTAYMVHNPHAACTATGTPYCTTYWHNQAPPSSDDKTTCVNANLIDLSPVSSILKSK